MMKKEFRGQIIEIEDDIHAILVKRFSLEEYEETIHLQDYRMRELNRDCPFCEKHLKNAECDDGCPFARWATVGLYGCDFVIQEIIEEVSMLWGFSIRTDGITVRSLRGETQIETIKEWLLSFEKTEELDA